jgi:hypothetical protein
MRDKMTTNMWEKRVWMKLGSVKDTGDTGTYFQRINAGRKEQDRILTCMIKTTITPAGLRDGFRNKVDHRVHATQSFADPIYQPESKNRVDEK